MILNTKKCYVYKMYFIPFNTIMLYIINTTRTRYVFKFLVTISVDDCFYCNNFGRNNLEMLVRVVIC